MGLPVKSKLAPSWCGENTLTKYDLMRKSVNRLGFPQDAVTGELRRQPLTAKKAETPNVVMEPPQLRFVSKYRAGKTVSVSEKKSSIKARLFGTVLS